MLDAEGIIGIGIGGKTLRNIDELILPYAGKTPSVFHCIKFDCLIDKLIATIRPK